MWFGVSCTPPYHNFLQSNETGGVTASVAGNVRSRDWESLGRQRPKPADARGRTVRPWVQMRALQSALEPMPADYGYRMNYRRAESPEGWR